MAAKTQAAKKKSTTEEVQDILSAAEYPLTAAEVSERMGRPGADVRKTLRRYALTRMRDGGRGRPAKVYALTPEALAQVRPDETPDETSQADAAPEGWAPGDVPAPAYPPTEWLGPEPGAAAAEDEMIVVVSDHREYTHNHSDDVEAEIVGADGLTVGTRFIRVPYSLLHRADMVVLVDEHDRLYEARPL